MNHSENHEANAAALSGPRTATASPDPLYLVERDFGKLGLEAHAYREHTRAKIVDLLAFEYLNAVKVLEIREDEHSVSDITEEILAEAEQMRTDSSQFGVGA